MTKLIIALDTSSLGDALSIASETHMHCAMFKLGLEFFATNGIAGVAHFQANYRHVFLDLKLHDVPTTVARTIRALLSQARPDIISVHAAGGIEMMKAAKHELESAGQGAPYLAAVTLLTSIQSSGRHCTKLARQAVKAGADFAICSPREAAAIDDDIRLITPGIRFPADPTHDHRRWHTPEAARRAGVEYAVVGRPITQAEDRAAAAAAYYKALRA
jgi:orotidine-5'-phosphate decarboxylase